MLLLRICAMKYDAIVVAGGVGKRANLGFNKVLFKMKNEKSVLENACSRFIEDRDCEKVIVVTNEDIRFGDDKVVFVSGGKERYDSVLNGLKEVYSPYVLIHDGARPFLDKEDLDNLKDNVIKYDYAILAKKAVDTIKYVENEFIDRTIDRRFIYYALTPQAFKSTDLKKAYENTKLDGITDDASIMEKCGYRVKIVEAKHNNQKLTNKDDFLNI